MKIRILLVFLGLLLSTALISLVSAEARIPSILLNQKLEAEHIPPTTKLVEWRLESEEEVRLIAESFIKNNKDRLGISLSDLKFQNLLFTRERDYDHFNPTGTAVYKQYYHEIPVYNGELRVHINAYGVVFSIHEIETNITAPTKPIITSEAAVEILKKRYNKTELNLRCAPALCILLNKLVWECDIAGPIYKNVFVDTQTGEIVWEWSNVVR